MKTEQERLQRDADRLRALWRLCGHVEDGSNEAVKISQDDATKNWHVRVGKRHWWGTAFCEAIDKAMADLPESGREG